jgi:hypothetical protein
MAAIVAAGMAVAVDGTAVAVAVFLTVVVGAASTAAVVAGITDGECRA